MSRAYEKAVIDEIPCWTIMNCTKQNCIARESQAFECWELAWASEDHRAEFNICADCVVRVVRTGHPLSFSLPVMAGHVASSPSCPLSR